MGLHAYGIPVPGGTLLAQPPVREVLVAASSPRVTASESHLPTLAIIVPTRNEALNVAELIRRVAAIPFDSPFEILFVDDSSDQTPGLVRSLAVTSPFPIRLLHRPPELRGDGLGGAVLLGMRNTDALWVCVMDADLQHPPELIPRLLEQTPGDRVDLVVATRYHALGRADGLTPLRRLISRGATRIGQLLLPGALRRVSDPMSGFFLIRRSAIPFDRVHPSGFKILVTLLAACPGLRIAEVPFVFQPRHAGESKGDLREGLRFLDLLLRLRLGDTGARMIRFALVGASGALVNMALLLTGAELFGLHYLAAVFAATQGSILSNFVLTERWVFVDHPPAGRARRAVGFLAMSNTVLLLHLPVMYGLTSLLGLHYAVSNVVTLVLLMLLRFASSRWWIWNPPSARREPARSHDGRRDTAPFSGLASGRERRLP